MPAWWFWIWLVKTEGFNSHTTFFKFLYSASTMLLLIIVSILAPLTLGFYVPGVTPKAYHLNDHVPLLVNKIVSENTQLPFAYGDLPFVCVPSAGAKRTWLNLGEVLRGDRFMSSDLEVFLPFIIPKVSRLFIAKKNSLIANSWPRHRVWDTVHSDNIWSTIERR